MSFAHGCSEHYALALASSSSKTVRSLDRLLELMQVFLTVPFSDGEQVAHKSSTRRPALANQNLDDCLSLSPESRWCSL